MRDLGWGDFWAVLAITMFVTALLAWSDYAGSIVEASRLQ